MNVDLSFLKRVAVFADLDEDTLVRISSLFKERHYKRSEIVFFEEDTGKYMYVVKKGRVKVSRLLPSGKEMILAFHESGESFGEMALLDGGTSPASVTAVVPTTIYVLSSSDFQNLLANQQINQALLKALCQRCRDAWAQIEILTFHNADARVRTALYQLCKKKGVEENGAIKIDMRLTHKELADITGISRETATRILSHLQAEELIRVETRQFIIPDPDRLVEELLFS